MKAKRNKKIGGYDYKGYYFCKEEGCKYWNIYKYEDSGIPNFCFAKEYARTFKECKEIIDSLDKENK